MMVLQQLKELKMSEEIVKHLKSIEGFFQRGLALGVPSVVHFGVYAKAHCNFSGDLHQVFYEGGLS